MSTLNCIGKMKSQPYPNLFFFLLTWEAKRICQSSVSDIHLNMRSQENMPEFSIRHTLEHEKPREYARVSIRHTLEHEKPREYARVQYQTCTWTWEAKRICQSSVLDIQLNMRSRENMPEFSIRHALEHEKPREYARVQYQASTRHRLGNGRNNLIQDF